MTARPQDVALLPCPFCGSACELVNMSDSIFVACAGSDCMGLLGGFDSDAEATSRWNTRANVTAALASAQAREDELRADRDSWAQQASDRTADWHAEYQRAERLEEALRAVEVKLVDGMDNARTTLARKLSMHQAVSIIRAALTPNATQTGETT